MKKQLIVLSTLIVALFFLAGCSGNIFMNFATLPEPPSPDVDASDEAAVENYVNDLDALFDSPSAVSAEDAAEHYATLTSLDPDTVGEDVYQQAQIAAASIVIMADPEANEVIDNIGNLLEGFITGSADDSGDDGTTTDSEEDPMEAMLTQLFPDSITAAGAEEEFEATLLTLSDAASAYDNLAATLESGEDLGLSDAETNELIQTAAIALVMDATMDALDSDPETAAGDFVDVYTNLTDGNADNDAEIDTYFDGGSMDTIFTDLLNDGIDDTTGEPDGTDAGSLYTILQLNDDFASLFGGMLGSEE